MIKTCVLRFSIVIMVITILASFILHFYKIDSIPYGYHVDELSDAVTVECLATEGVDAHDNHYPIFGQLNYGTPKPATYMYPAVLWGKVFNFTVPSLRSFSVAGHLLGIVGLFFLGRLFFGNTGGLWVVFAATISPWVWVSSRVAFESLLAPTFFIWGLYFFFRRQTYIHWALAGLFFAAAMYSYPPMRLQIPLMLLTLGVYSIRKMKISLSLVTVFCSFLIAPLIPLFMNILNAGEALQRFKSISISAPAFLKMIGKTDSFQDLLQIFLSNYQLHLTPQFLFLTGDPSLVHSTGHFGILSWLDLVALFAAFFFLGILLTKWGRERNPWVKDWMLLLWIVVNIFLGIIPSALTNSELPNSLRIVGSWPFVCLLTGYFMVQLQQRWCYLGVVLVLVGVLFFVSFQKVYFGQYQQESKGMFSFWTLDQANAAKTDEDWMKFMIMYRGQDYHFRYFLIHYRKDSCTSTRLKWEKQGDLLVSLHLNF